MENEKATGKDSAYWQKYWEEHRQEILERRRMKYRTDKDFRQKAIQRSRASYAKKRVGRRQPDPERQLPHREKEFKVGGRETCCFSIGHLASITGYSIYTLRAWLADGIIPSPPVVDSFGRMWFDPPYAKSLNNVLTLYRGEGWSLEIFKQKVAEHWGKAPKDEPVEQQSAEVGG